MKFINSLVAKYQESKTRRANIQEFQTELLAAASDGVLTDEEIRALDQLQTTLGISPEQIQNIRLQVYERAYRAVTSDDAVSASEEAELNKLQSYLAIPDSALQRTKQELMRFRMLAEIQQGRLPTVGVGSVILQKAETPHWSEPSELIEERVVGRRYEGRSSGVSIRIAKGVSYRVGASRGHLVVDTANVPVSSGDLILTNKRVIFRGDKKSFNYRLDKLLDVQLFQEGLRLTDSNGKPRTVKFFRRDNSDIVGSILTQTINRFMSSL